MDLCLVSEKKVNEYKFLILSFYWEERINWDWAFFSLHILPIIKVPDIIEWMNVYFSQTIYIQWYMRYKSKYTCKYITYILNSKSLDLAWLYIIDHYLIDRNHLPLSMKWSSWLALNGSCIIINVGCCGEKKTSTACLPFCVLETIETCSS